MASEAGGRALPGRIALSQAPVALGAAACAALVLATRLPLRTRYLLNWDADQFALGIGQFDVLHHQPHPPGYPGYILLGRLLMPVFGDANAALVALSILGECAGVAIAFLFARALFGSFAGWVTALAMMTSPLFWYYGEAANTYALEPALSMGVAWFAWRAWNGDRAGAVPAAVLLAAGGALRPSLAVLLAPLALAAVWRLRDRRALLTALGAGLAATSAWAVPLVIASGGPTAYWHASASLGGDVTSSTAIWRAGLGGLMTTSDAVVKGIMLELGLFAVIAVFGLGLAGRLLPPGQAPALHGYALFAWIWVLPGLLTFLLIHIGEIVYVGVFMPAIFLALGPAVSATVRSLGRPGWAWPLTAAGAAAGVLIFLLPLQSSLFGGLRQHDHWVESMVAATTTFDPDHTVLVADAYAVGSYRTAQVYLPQYHRIAVARDRSGRLGEIYGDVYMPERFDDSSLLVLPAGTDTVVFMDRSVVDAYVADPERLEVVKLPAGARMYVWRGARPAFKDGWIWLGSGYHDRRGLAA